MFFVDADGIFLDCFVGILLSGQDIRKNYWGLLQTVKKHTCCIDSPETRRDMVHVLGSIPIGCVESAINCWFLADS